MSKPLCIDLFCGVGGFTEGAILEGYDCVGFDNEIHVYGNIRYPAQLVVQDVLTLHGSQFKDAALIWASPPCQAYSWMAMPWKLAKAKAAVIRADTTGQALADLNRLFDACFRIQKEASIAAGRHIPMVVENVRGAIPWVGRSRWNFGSFHLWGDVPALMPIRLLGDFNKMPAAVNEAIRLGKSPPRWTNRAEDGIKVGGAAERRWEDRPVKWLRDAYKVPSESGRRTEGTVFRSQYSSKSSERKMASAMIAKIPTALSRHIASTFMPK